MFEGRAVLVTGADGFIGSHLAERLVREGACVRALVFYNAFDSRGWLDSSPPDVRGALDVVMGDIRDVDQVRRAMDGCEIVFHLAALVGIPHSYLAPRSYVETNVVGSLNVLEAARQCGVARVVHTSTSEVYGTARYVPIDEEHPLAAQSPYAASKIGADQLALAYRRSFGLPVSIIRPFNTYGPRQSLRAVIPAIITQLASGRRQVRLGNLSPTRDFSFVEDVVSGFLAVAAADGSLGQVTNIGTDFEVSIRRLAELIAEVMGCPIEFGLDEQRVRPPGSEVERLRASHEKARRVLGWQPEVSGEAGLRRGLQVTAEWYSRQENLARYHDRDYAV